MKEYEAYLIEQELLFLYENNMIETLNEETVQPEVIEWAYKIAKSLGIHFDMKDKEGGFLDTHVDKVPNEYKNTAFFVDPITKKKFIVGLKDLWDGLMTAHKRLKTIRIASGEEVPPEPKLSVD